MNTDISKALEAIKQLCKLREGGSKESVLRSEFVSRLRLMFPSDANETWINQYSIGTEAQTKIGISGAISANRFIDNLIGSTTIEYESDLRIESKREEGYRQVKEHVTGLVNDSVPISQIRGILSDTVEWYVYEAIFLSEIEPGTCTVDDIQLNEIDRFDTVACDETTAEKLVLFLRQNLAREKSRPLVADNLALDLGLESPAYGRSIEVLTNLVNTGRNTDSSVEVATKLWSRFVDHLESDKESFRIDHYVDEAYLNIMARLLSANALAGSAIISHGDELESILNGSHFRNEHQIDNFIEQDYFGWLTDSNHISGILPIAHEIQRDLYAYDFSFQKEENLFARLITQLASRNKRKLLGQEETPNWLAKYLVERCFDGLPDGEAPEIVDMCCGSGTILSEIIKVSKDRYGYNDIIDLQKVATGFDINPLAVTFAKTTWIITLTDEIKEAKEPVTVPIYHADSLFAITPVSDVVPILDENDPIDITLDGKTIQLSAGLVQPVYRQLFDRLIDWAYDEAKQTNGEAALSIENAERTLDVSIAAVGVELSSDLRQSVTEAIFELAVRMKELADAGRNGIWAFILRNTYRPGLLAGQFNGLVSNPPWLAMSALANNPYRKILSHRASLYGVLPVGQSFLHLDLSTTHLLHAIDRYLKTDASIACLVPGTILNGDHHERFRQCDYLGSDRPVAFSLKEIWQVSPGTFKYPGVTLIGKKTDNVAISDMQIEHACIVRREDIEEVEFSHRRIGRNRTAWVLEKSGIPAATAGRESISQQGADLMPRRAVCIEILDDESSEYRVNTPAENSKWAFTVKQAKELQNEKFPGYVAPHFIYRIAQSENLLPFFLGPHEAPIAIPATRDGEGTWSIHDPAEIRRMGFTRTARRFAEINKSLETVGKGNTLEYRINLRNKLFNQVFPNEGYMVLSGAGGKHICATCVPINKSWNVVVDQTLYWLWVSNKEDAWFLTGMLNSNALTEAIMPFNPQGDFGPRHIHTLPYRLIPPYLHENRDHRVIAESAFALADTVVAMLRENPYVANPNKSLSVRRRKIRENLAENPHFERLDSHCAAILGVRSGLGE